VLMDPKLQQQMQKIRMHVPESLANDPTVLQRCPEGAGVTLITNRRVEFKGFLERPTGMPGNPISTQALVAKFQSCFKHSGMRNGMAISIADRLLGIDKCPDIRAIFEKLGE
jgi:hypothetical protein